MATMIHARRLAHATFETPDVERQIAYHTDILGLTLVERDSEAAYLASTLDHHSVLIKHGSAAACLRLSFQIGPNDDLGELARQLSDLGVASERRSNPFPAPLCQTRSSASEPTNGSR